MESYKTYTTSQLADAAAVGPQTLRYYERRGLLPEPPRTAGGHRIYGPGHLQRLLFIQRAQALGFHLQEVQEMLTVQDLEGDEEVAEAVGRLMKKVDQKLEALTAIRASLEALRSGCGEADSPDCPMIESLLGEPV